MKAIVFAAGIGSRLKPFTEHHPKALAPVGLDTALGFVLRRLVAAGADSIVVNVHHFANQVIDWVANNPCGVPVEISDESSLLLDTGGGLAKIWRESKTIQSLGDDEPLVIHNADILTDFPLSALCTRAKDALGAIFAEPNRTTARHFLFDNNGMLRGWNNIKTGAVRPDNIDATKLQAAAFGGVHCLSRQMLQRISDFCGNDLHPFGITDYYIDNCTTDNSICIFTPNVEYRWADIGNPERLAEAQELFKNE